MPGPPMHGQPMPGHPMYGHDFGGEPPMPRQQMPGHPMHGPPMHGHPMHGPPMHGPPMHGHPMQRGVREHLQRPFGPSRERMLKQTGREMNIERPQKEMFSKSPETKHSTNEHFKGELSCRQIADHISNCPICSKLYKRQRAVYIIVIIVLAILLLICFKKIIGT